MAFRIIFDENAIIDIDNALDYYGLVSPPVKLKFYKSLHSAISKLKKSPFFQIRYLEVRCLPLKKFPYMVHYKVFKETNVVLILGVINTYRDPEISYLN